MTNRYAHYVRHMLRNGDYVSTEFQCRAPVGTQCRMACDKCHRLQREQCECDMLGDVPDLQDQGECMLMVWLTEDAPEECFNGEPQPVRGPDWQPIVPEWNGDNYEWDYAT